MALNYTNLFGDIGKTIATINVFDTLSETTLPAEELILEDAVTGQDLFELAVPFPSMFEGMQNAVIGWISSLASWTGDRITEKTTVLDELSIGDESSVQTVLDEIYRQMVEGEEFVDMSVVTVGASAYHAENNGTGILFRDKILDGVTSPGSGMRAEWWYAYDMTLDQAYTDLVIDHTTDTIITSSAHAFVAADVGRIMIIVSGTNFTPGTYEILSVAGGKATLDNTVGSNDASSGVGHAFNAKWPGEAGYIGTDSELTGSETMTLTCVGDSETDGYADGGEQFSWEGDVSSRTPYDYRGSGSGRGSISVANGSSLLSNGEFEDWTLDSPYYLPTSWDVDSGTGANVKRYGDLAYAYTDLVIGDPATTAVTSSAHAFDASDVGRILVVESGTGFTAGTYTIASQVGGVATLSSAVGTAGSTSGVADCLEAPSPLRGTYPLQLLGDGSTATIQISQLMDSLTPLKRYFVGCWVKGNGSVAAGTLTIQMEGTAYTAGAAEKIEMDDTALAAQTTWGSEGFFFTAPREIPTDFSLVVKITGTLTTEISVYIDGLVLAEPTWHGGVCAAILAGGTVFLREDRMTFTVANAGEGLFQEFFRQWYGRQLLSSSAGYETIADTLAE